MIRVLLVDDDILILNQLNQIFQELDESIQVVGQTSNGLDAIKYAKQLKPDLIIMDIEMPKMNGISATTHILQQFPATNILVLSNFDSFHYLRDMMKAGAMDYMLKHELSKELISQKLDQLQHKLLEKESTQFKEHYFSLAAKQAFFKSLLNQSERDPKYEHLMMMQKEFSSKKNVLIVFQIFNFSPLYHPGDNELNKDRMLQSILNVLNNLFSSLGNGIAITMRNGEFVVLLDYTGINSQQKILSSTQEYINLITGNLKKLFKLDLQSSYCVISGNITDLHNHYHQLKEKIGNSIINNSSWDQQPVINILDEIDFVKALDLMDPSYCYAILQRVLTPENLESSPSEKQKPLFLRLFIICENFLEKNGYDNEIERLHKFANTIDFTLLASVNSHKLIEYFTELINRMLKSNVRNYSDNVQKAILFIKKYYCKDISLYDVATELNLSEVYLSKLFKNEVGTSFIDYITKLRIDKAKHMLTESNLPPKEVGEAVSYHNYTYFIRVFKQHAGKTPLQYRRNNKYK